MAAVGAPAVRVTRPRLSALSRLLRAALVLVGLGVLLAAAYITATRLAFAMLYVFLLLLAASWLWTRIGVRRLAFQREAPSGAYEAGEAFVEHLQVDNGSLLGLPWIEISDQAGIPGYDAGRVLSLGARKSRRWRSDGRFSSRGAFVMGPLTIATGDPFGLFRATRVVTSSSRVIVYPRLVDATPLVARLSGAAGDNVAVGRQMDTPPEAFGIREYNPDDGVNRIHWPSTARLGRPMSRSFEKYEGTDMVIALDLDRHHHHGAGPTSSLERAVSLAASVAMIGVDRGQAVGLLSNDLAQTSIRPGRGLAQIRSILESLALAAADGDGDFERVVTSALARRGEQTLFVITPSISERWIDRLGAARRGGARTTIVRLLEGAAEPAAVGSRRPRQVGESAVWWDIEVGDAIFATSLMGHRPMAVAEREAAS